MTQRETHLVELVDAAGVPVGSATVDQAHRAPGQLHRAFSVFLRDPDGRVLLQQRAGVKTRFPLRWGNTACGHPAPGEDLVSAAAVRLAEEVGVTGVALRAVGVYPYYAEDPASGRVEYEYDHVLVGDVPASVAMSPDPDEVAALQWISVPVLCDAMAAEPRTYVPWLGGVLDVLTSAPHIPGMRSPVLEGSSDLSGCGGSRELSGRGGSPGLSGRGGSPGLSGRGGSPGLSGRGGSSELSGRGGDG